MAGASASSPPGHRFCMRMRKRGCILKTEFFYIMAVHMIHKGNFLYYHVTTNAGTSEFCPALGRKLPDMVISWLEKYQSNFIRLSPTVCAVYAQLG